MTISELIAKLETLKQLHGDIRVCYEDDLQPDPVFVAADYSQPEPEDLIMI
jgi:hypothetical protein